MRKSRYTQIYQQFLQQQEYGKTIEIVQSMQSQLVQTRKYAGLCQAKQGLKNSCYTTINTTDEQQPEIYTFLKTCLHLALALSAMHCYW